MSCLGIKPNSNLGRPTTNAAGANLPLGRPRCGLDTLDMQGLACWIGRLDSLALSLSLRGLADVELFRVLWKSLLVAAINWLSGQQNCSIVWGVCSWQSLCVVGELSRVCCADFAARFSLFLKRCVWTLGDDHLGRMDFKLVYCHSMP